MASAEEVAVFVETNLGTHIAMAVPEDITAGDFKRRLEKTHASCSPSLGEIQVCGLMVKRKSYFYYIPEPMLLKHIFRDFQKAWFICVEARLVNSSREQCASVAVEEEGKAEESLAKHETGAEQVCFDSRGGWGPPLSSMSEAKTAGKQRWQLGKDRTESQKVRTKLLAAANNIRKQGVRQKIPSAMSFICRSDTGGGGGRRRRYPDRTVIASLAKFLVFQIPETE